MLLLGTVLEKGANTLLCKNWGGGLFVLNLARMMTKFLLAILFHTYRKLNTELLKEVLSHCSRHHALFGGWHSRLVHFFPWIYYLFACLKRLCMVYTSQGLALWQGSLELPWTLFLLSRGFDYKASFYYYRLIYRCNTPYVGEWDFCHRSALCEWFCSFNK